MKKYLLIILSLPLLAAGCSIPSLGGNTNKGLGIMQTTDAAASWQEYNTITGATKDSLSNYEITALAARYENGSIAPNYPILAGVLGAGLLKMDKQNGSWDRLVSKINVYDIAWDLNDINHILVSGEYEKKGRVLATKDAGKTWTEIFNEASEGNPVKSVAFSPFDSQKIMIGTGYGSLIMSSDAGVSWKSLKTYGDKVDKILWNKNGVFVLSPSYGLYVSNDEGNTFTELTTPISTSGMVDSVVNTVSGRKASNFYKVDISDSGTILLAADVGAYLSNDLGKTWTFLQLPTLKNDVTLKAVAIGSDGALYIGADANIFISKDNGNTFETKELKTTGKVYNILPFNVNNIIIGFIK